MQYSDLDDRDFQSLRLVYISSEVDPLYCMQSDTSHSFSMSRLGIGYPLPQSTPISCQHCADIMFDEMKMLSRQFARKQYAHLIGELVDYFHYGSGHPWTSWYLDRAYERHYHRNRNS